MAYLNEPNKGIVSEKGEVWEEYGREEKRYLWNGAYLDLCNLPVTEYMKTIFVTSGSGGSGGGGESKPSVTKNNVIVEERIESEGKVFYKAVADQPVSSKNDVKIKVNTSTGLQTITLTILPGSKESSESAPVIYNPNTDMKPRLDHIENNTMPDTKFEYETPAPVVYPYVYTMYPMTGKIEEMTDEYIIENSIRKIPVEMETEKKTQAFRTKINEVEIPNFDDMTLDQKGKAMLENSTDIVIITDRKIKDINVQSDERSDLPQWKKIMGKEGAERKLTDPATGYVYDIWVRKGTEDGEQTMIKGENEDKNVNYVITYE